MTCIETFQLETEIEQFLDKFHNFSNEFLSNVDLMPGTITLIVLSLITQSPSMQELSV